MNKVTVDIGEVPGALRESFRSVLAQHNLVVCMRIHGRLYEVPRETYESLLRELGNNGAQNVAFLDEEIEKFAVETLGLEAG